MSGLKNYFEMFVFCLTSCYKIRGIKYYFNFFMIRKVCF
mgnify:CR=1 FL=1